jgi:uncharacterized protein (TIGR02145 family)
MIKIESALKTVSFFVLVISLYSLLSCNRIDLPPLPILDVFPSSGDTSIFFDYNADRSEDDRCFAVALKYRWDFNGDGLWDTEFSENPSIAYQYKQPGSYLVQVEVRDVNDNTAIANDSIKVFGLNQDIDTLFDNRDGNRYRIVKINGQWWMSENIRYGTAIPTEREQSDNDTVEMYRDFFSERYDTVGGIYLWLEAMQYKVNEPQGICPEGWHIPTREDWQRLFTSFPYLYALQYYGYNGLSNLHLNLRNGGLRTDGVFKDINLNFNVSAGFWSSAFTKEDRFYKPYYCIFEAEQYYMIYDRPLPTGRIQYFSVRCVKDF